MNEKKINVVVADDNREFCGLLKDYLSCQDDIELIGICNDGFEVLELVKNQKTDLIILDIIMPRLDGLAVLEKINALKLSPKPKLIILSAVGQEKIIQRAMELGASYYITKPFDLDVFMERIRQIMDYGAEENILPALEAIEEEAYCAETQSTADFHLQEQITTMLHEIGIPAHIKGYIYIREAILSLLNNLDTLSVNKELYLVIASNHDTTSSKVERAIRHAIHVAFVRGKTDTIKLLFSPVINKNKTKPTNGEFIALLADRLRLQNKAL
ncbi:sporulation transcription factor Spo0A [Clostridium sp. 19966]|uniref:sporulation transcription factor Spo0A n=1 Tax=Clostridium sp. 19966 TaxID=2768166 RepID=UPI0028DE802B|nr:sporulation transcription factor Spo0A [Clostridium sp. 19966]MDT8717954.1 sporulation transcription factor Spo0A [Clostridium sp. 19966]